MTAGPPDRAVRRVLIAHPGGELYGSDRVLRDTVVELLGRGWQVTVTLPVAGPLVEVLLSDGATVEICPAAVLRKAALAPAGFCRLLVTALTSLLPTVRLLRRARPDVVYVSTLTIPMWLPLARLLRRPTVCHVHEAESAAPRTVRWALAAPLLLARRVVTNSRFSLRVLTDVIPALDRRAEVVYNPVPGPAEPSPPRRNLTPPVELLYVGRLSERKGPHVAVAATGELARRGVDVKLRVLGDVFSGYESYAEQLRASVRTLGLTDRVSFEGFQADVWPAIAAADIVLVPSTVDEPFGNTAVEAVLGARPTVASSSGGLTEALEGYRSATLVPPGEPVALADAVEAVVARWGDLRDAATSDAREAARRHSKRAYGDRIEEVLDSARLR